MELSGDQSLTIFFKNFILDVPQVLEYASEFTLKILRSKYFYRVLIFILISPIIGKTVITTDSFSFRFVIVRQKCHYFVNSKNFNYHKSINITHTRNKSFTYLAVAS